MNKLEKLKEQLTLLETQVADIKSSIDALDDKHNSLTKWEPKGGLYYVIGTGEVKEGCSARSSRLFGTERSTEELAEQAAIEMRSFNRLLAYRDELLDTALSTKEFIQGARNTYVVFDYSTVKYTTIENRSVEVVGLPSFPPDIAEALARKLNSGEVVF